MRHVDPSKLLLQRTDFTGEIPDWFDQASLGSVHCQGWYGGAVLVTIETKYQHRFYVAVIAVSGLFATDEQMNTSDPNDKDDSILGAATSVEMRAFTERAVHDLYPFLRQEVYQLTGRFQGISGVMLQPQPKLDVPGEG
ncbi:hypothetical protein KIH27_12200 [Mycobacterium sp. M1]|uniref:Uncharacterized protein n=1 Tax=Mycolicibacter acidiphilus TaxID=2835306 RepID=A0ABS5RJ72_9MYCO|nr:hypothetical protein [Mycolicibacter acidiphilus]MBS9534347.1 hypothetical protein [Mycolicibacter acidiphilus]